MVKFRDWLCMYKKQGYCRFGEKRWPSVSLGKVMYCIGLMWLWVGLRGER